MTCKSLPGGRGRYCRYNLVCYIAVLVLTGFVALMVWGCGEEEKSSPAASSTANTTAPADELTEEWVATRAATKIGSSTLLREVTITGSEAGKQVRIEVDRPEVCHDGAVVGTVAVFAQNMMGLIYNKYSEEIADVEIVMYGTEQGVVIDEVAMRLEINRASAQGIDWFTFDETNMFHLATTYYMHPKIEESFRLEGALPYDQQS